jgi:hypothetical protein
MDLADMPRAVKERLLEQLREQLGPGRYHALVDRFGEDGLIRMAIEASPAPSGRPKGGVWKRAWNARLFEIVGFVCTPLWLFLMGSFSGWRGFLWLALNFICFTAFASLVGGIAGLPGFWDRVGLGAVVGLCITAPTYLFCVLALWVKDLAGGRRHS